jgi:Carboxypeptidase regulatory-like domain
MHLGFAILLCAGMVQGTSAGRIADAATATGAVSGTIVDALTGRPVEGAVISDGKQGGTLSDREGRFVLAGLPGETADVIVQHPSYVIFAEPRVPVGSRVEIKLQPSSIQAEPVEIVETREEDLRPMLVRQDPISFSAEFKSSFRGREMKGVYRVCVGKDGKPSLVAALEPAGKADPFVKEGIARGWEYRPLSKPACFLWRVTLRFNAPFQSPFSPQERAPPPAPPILRR